MSDLRGPQASTINNIVINNFNGSNANDVYQEQAF